MAALNLDLLDHALSTYLGNSPQPSKLPPSPPHSEIPSTSRNTFLYLVEEKGARYEAARSLIDDDDYWRKEEMHFQMLNNLILDYHCRQDNVVSLADAECPPMDVLRTLWSGMQAQEAALEGWSSNYSLFLFWGFRLTLQSSESRPSYNPLSPCPCNIQACRAGGANKVDKRQRRRNTQTKHTIASRTRSKHSLKKVALERILRVNPP